MLILSKSVRSKKYVYSVVCLFIMACCIIYSVNITNYVIWGIKICLYSVIPSLLPFMLITNYMQAHNLCTTVSAIFHPIFNKLMRLSEYGTFALIIGFTSGYPMGAKIIGDLYSANNISFKEAKLLITFCNISSISFLINYVLNKCLNNCIPPWLIILFVYLPPLLTGLFNSRFIKFTNNNNTVYTESTFNSIHATFYSLAKLSIYIICFNILVNFIININKIPVLQKYIIVGLTEITTASLYISTESNLYLKIYLTCSSIILGGLSIMFQSFSFLNNSALKKYYVLGKIEQFLIFNIIFFIWMSCN